MLNYEQLQITGDMFMGYIKEGKIYNNQGGLIGRTEEEYQAMAKAAEEFQEVLYQHDILQRPKTPEQINQELQESMQKMAAMMSTLQTELKEIKEKKNVKEHSVDTSKKSPK